MRLSFGAVRLVVFMICAGVPLSAWAAPVEPVRSLAANERAALLDTLKDLVSIESGSGDREGLDKIAGLIAEGIGTSVHYRPLHEMTYWKERYRCEPDDFVVASRYFAGAITLPLFAGMTDAQVDRVAAVVRDTLG